MTRFCEPTLGRLNAGKENINETTLTHLAFGPMRFAIGLNALRTLQY